MFLRSVVGLLAANRDLVDVFLLGLFFDPEDEACTFLQNISGFISGYTVLYSRRGFTFLLHYNQTAFSNLENTICITKLN
jgi:hypothetical protein